MEKIMAKKAIFSLLLMLLWMPFVCAQQSTENKTLKPCKTLTNAKAIDIPMPIFAKAAKVAKAFGKVEVKVLIDEKGDVISADAASGNPLLFNSAIEAAKKAKYSPTLCDEIPEKTNGLIVYDFPEPEISGYFIPTKIEDFADVTRDNNFYEAVLNLSENDKIAFGLSDKNFHGEKTLTRGEFAEFLRKTLDSLSNRAKLANVNPKDIELYKPLNKHKLAAVTEIKDFDEFQPFADSVKVLLEKYNIALVNEKASFNASSVMSNNEIIEIWQAIFGDDALPINFPKLKINTRIFTRGDFAIFLNESLDVLTYKVLPN
jgi:Gram-negative bacterial TonB protein C-terminal/S-layer homology domain